MFLKETKAALFCVFVLLLQIVKNELVLIFFDFLLRLIR